MAWEPTLQEQANMARALLIIQEMIESKLCWLSGEIVVTEVERNLRDLKARGVEPDEDASFKWATVLVKHKGGFIQ